MKRLIGILGWLGLGLVVAALILRIAKPEQFETIRMLAWSGLVVTIIYALTQWRDIGRSFEGKNAKYGSVAIGSILVFVGILVAVNWIASRQNKRWDLTESKQFSLSDQTRQILSGLKAPLNVHVFYAGQDSEGRYRDQFEEYVYLSKQISVEYVNGDSKPTVAEKFEITAYPTIVFEYQGRTQRATSGDEQAITNALKKILEGKTKKAYFLQGHGERDPDDQSTALGYKGASAGLVDENFEVAKLQLAQAGSIPADAMVIIVAGATIDLLPKETEQITDYLKNGGKLLLLLDPPAKGGKVQPEGLIALAKSWGIQVGYDLIVDPQGQALGAGAEVPIGMPTQHQISAKLRGTAMAFSVARSVAPIEGGTDGKVAQTITESGPASWAEKDIEGLYKTSRPTKDTDKGDKAGPISIGAAVSAPSAAPAPAPAPTDKPGQKPEEGPKPESRLVVYGDSDFASNRWVQQLGNGNLFLNSVNWLAQQEDLIAIRPRDPEDRRVELTEGQATSIRYLTILVLPLLLFANAVRVYWKRR